MPYHLKKLLPRHYKVMELCLKGKNRKDVAKEVGLTPRAISNITGSPIFQDELARRRKERARQQDQAAAKEIINLGKKLRTVQHQQI